jgi:hypothetical protein
MLLKLPHPLAVELASCHPISSTLGPNLSSKEIHTAPRGVLYIKCKEIVTSGESTTRTLTGGLGGGPVPQAASLMTRMAQVNYH